MSSLIAWLIGCALGFASSIPAAGPLALLIVTSGLERDPRRGVRLAVGGAAAEGLWALVAFLGLGTVLASSPKAIPIARASAAVIILVLGAAMIAKRAPSSQPVAPVTASSGRSHYLVGFSLVALNPGFLVTWIGVAAAISGHSQLQAASEHPAWSALGAFVGVIGWFMVLLALARRGERAMTPRTIHRVTRGLGVVLVGIGLWLAVDAVRQLIL